MKNVILILSMLTLTGIESFAMAAEENQNPDQSNQIDILRTEREAKFKKHLSDLYEKACMSGDTQWLTQNRQLLIDKHIASRLELDTVLEALQVPEREKKRKKQSDEEQERLQAQRKREEEQHAHILCFDRIKRAKTEQDAIRDGLVWLYGQLQGQDANYALLLELASIQDLQKFFDVLNALTQNAAIMKVVGAELQQLRGHMLYRVWEDPQQLAHDPKRVLNAFNLACVAPDINAMINLYRDFIKMDSSLQHMVAGNVFDIFTRAMGRKDIQALIDLYIYFFKGTDREEAALLLLSEYTQQFLAAKDIGSLKRLSICFENTPYEQEIKNALSALEVDMGLPSGSVAPVERPGASLRQVLYDEWQAACANQDLNRLLELRESAIAQGIVEADVAEAIIQSVTLIVADDFGQAIMKSITK